MLLAISSFFIKDMVVVFMGSMVDKIRIMVYHTILV